MLKFGLIGYPLTHSFSKKYFTEIFEREGINAVYENYPLTSIGEFPALIVIPFLDECTPEVKAIGACNCISNNGGLLKGHNTDVIGFEQSLRKRLTSDHRKAIVLGTGGASKAVCYVLSKLDISFIIVSRSAGTDKYPYEAITKEMVEEHKLIINTTPVGMYPNVDDCPDIPYNGIGSRHYLYDLVYNPEKTLFLQKGEERGATISNGYEMLIIQAQESRKIWKF
jgi:shikimate dehydrogenase